MANGRPGGGSGPSRCRRPILRSIRTATSLRPSRIMSGSSSAFSEPRSAPSPFRAGRPISLPIANSACSTVDDPPCHGGNEEELRSAQEKNRHRLQSSRRDLSRECPEPAGISSPVTRLHVRAVAGGKPSRTACWHDSPVGGRSLLSAARTSMVGEHAIHFTAGSKTTAQMRHYVPPHRFAHVGTGGRQLALGAFKCEGWVSFCVRPTARVVAGASPLGADPGGYSMRFTDRPRQASRSVMAGTREHLVFASSRLIIRTARRPHNAPRIGLRRSPAGPSRF